MRDFNLLESLRSQLDRTDEEILFLIKRRLQTAKKIAQYKFKNEMEIFQPERENQLMNDRISKGHNMQLNQEFVIDLFELLVKESKDFQQKEVKKLKEKNSY